VAAAELGSVGDGELEERQSRVTSTALNFGSALAGLSKFNLLMDFSGYSGAKTRCWKFLK
jgi:hypothetical protein